MAYPVHDFKLLTVYTKTYILHPWKGSVFRLYLVIFCVIITNNWWDGIFRVLTWPEDNLSSFEYFRRIALTTCLQKARRGWDSSLSSLLNKIHNSNKRWQPTFFHSDTNHVLCQVLMNSFNKIHVLVVTVEFIWLWFLNILSFNFVSILNKSFRFTLLRRSYVNCLAVFLTNHCQSYSAFLFHVRCSKWLCCFVAICPQW